jgi:hypothetical protein
VDLLEARLEELMRQLRGINAPGVRSADQSPARSTGQELYTLTSQNERVTA